MFFDFQIVVFEWFHNFYYMLVEIFAYIDPGSGFGIAQVLTALAGVFFVYKTKIKARIKSLASKFNRKDKGAKDPE